MSTKARLGAGDIEILLDGETVVLRPTLKACQAISRQADGVRGAIGRVLQYDFDAIVNVIGLGLGWEGKDLKVLPEKVYRTGMTELAAPAIRYLNIVANGGRIADGEVEDEGENPPNG